jgi:hypothetical protein
MPEMIFTDQPLVISIDHLNINLELKNIFCINDATLDRGDAIRIYALLKLPEKLFPGGYRNAYNEIERWFPIYRSSGTNSGHKGSWHPFYGSVASPIEITPSRQNQMHTLLKGFFKFVLENPTEEEKVANMENNLLKKIGSSQRNAFGVAPISYIVNNLRLNSWMIKCGMTGILMPTKYPPFKKFNNSIKLETLEDLEKNILEHRFNTMYTTLMSVEALSGKLQYKHPLGRTNYLCNNFFNLVNDTLSDTNRFKVQETKTTTSIEIVIKAPDGLTNSNKIFTINNLINPSNASTLINNSIGTHNIFGINLNRQSPDPEIENIIEIVNMYEEKFKSYCRGLGWGEEKIVNTMKIFLEVLIDRQDACTINEIFEKLIADPNFIKTIRSGDSLTRYINVGGKRNKRSRKRNKRSRKRNKRSRKRNKRSRKRNKRSRKRNKRSGKTF